MPPKSGNFCTPVQKSANSINAVKAADWLTALLAERNSRA
jgi:hypothetical protein